VLITRLPGASDIYPHFGCWPCWPSRQRGSDQPVFGENRDVSRKGSRGIPISGQRKGLARSGVPAVDSERISGCVARPLLPVTSAYAEGWARGRALACANLAV
jgi:hypothetical protein